MPRAASLSPSSHVYTMHFRCACISQHRPMRTCTAAYAEEHSRGCEPIQLNHCRLHTQTLDEDRPTPPRHTTDTLEAFEMTTRAQCHKRVDVPLGL
eukprot:31347-Eustigmatos_ZCMA.PRE.1